ncbi:preprotein translocase subunit SecG [Novosphingobium sp.]|uniref:preprotein translocase subunit SecG n=1 Tax=Novosphingobium sp. TaxID=1874826 RepID=UPI0025D8F30F|nr:preprotein translocase subunit SecG [Novosphingobium sp.]
MSLFIFLMVVQAIVAALLVTVVLLQQSEGGGLGVGGSPAGLMSARGAADFMTRATGILAALFVALSIALAALAVSASSASKIDTTLDRRIAPAPGSVPAKDPLAAPAAPAGQAPAGPAPAGPAPAKDPLKGATGQ